MSIDLQYQWPQSGVNHHLNTPSVSAYVPAASGLRAKNSAFSNARPSWIGLLVVVFSHLALAAYLLAHDRALPIDLAPQIPMTVSLIKQAEIPVAPVIEPQPEPPKPIVRKLPTPKKIEQVVETNVPTQTPVQPPIAAVETQELAHEAEPSPPQAEAQVEAVVAKTAPKEDVIELPKFGVSYLNNPKPSYPSISRRLNEQGRVLFKVLVNVSGEPESVEIATSSGYERLDQAAFDAVKRWKFIPAKRNNQPMSAYVMVPLKFDLN